MRTIILKGNALNHTNAEKETGLPHKVIFSYFASSSSTKFGLRERFYRFLYLVPKGRRAIDITVEDGTTQCKNAVNLLRKMAKAEGFDYAVIRDYANAIKE